MLKVFVCECGFTCELEHSAYYNTRIQCSLCGLWHVRLGSSAKCLEVFEDAIRLLSRGHAEKAAQGFAQGYELWLKHVLRGRDPEWLGRHPKANIRELADAIKRLFGLEKFAPIEKNYRNLLEHDPDRLTTVAEARAYCEHVIAIMKENLREIMGPDVWRRGEVGELDVCSSSDSDQHVEAWLTYWRHYGSGNIGYVETVWAWWSAYKGERWAWHEATW